MPLRVLRPLLLLAALLAGLFVLALASGSQFIAPADLPGLLWGGAGSPEAEILQRLRLPRALAAMSVGALLALAGALMQVLLRNPLADPYVLGLSGGAALGALSMIALGCSVLEIGRAHV